MSNILGVIVVARNGDRLEYHQDPKTYAGGFTETTALGEDQSHKLGQFLRSTYLDSGSDSYIKDMRSDLVDNQEIHVRAKAGGEGTVVFDSAIALLQGLFPPNPDNKITLAKGQTIVAPLGGYQYVPVETVEPGNDRSLEPWTNCPNFEKHIANFYKSDEFKKQEQAAQPFFNNIKDFVFGRPTTLENIWNIYDYINSELEHNKTYAYRLPPTMIEQAQSLVNFHENGIFSDKKPDGIGNIAGRTILHSILTSLERIAFNDDPLQFLLIETTYQPFISFVHQTEIVKQHPDLQGVPDFASALAIELRRGEPPDLRDFLRFKFRNGSSGNFETVQVFGHKGDIPLTEFIYRIEDSAITSNRQWAKVCGAKSTGSYVKALGYSDDLSSAHATATYAAGAALVAFVLLFGAFVVSKFTGSRRNRYVRLPDDEVSSPFKLYSSSKRTDVYPRGCDWDLGNDYAAAEHNFYAVFYDEALPPLLPE
ncbi:hypothetical protein PLICRDRAFT_97310 [Plicaturopsis crispa FD-325 SS-3]|nr:hypothetical protein PLICRDRAFT_97310 [Plicaturopsis crispa FD-325 SS-3]